MHAIQITEYKMPNHRLSSQTKDELNTFNAYEMKGRPDCK